MKMLKQNIKKQPAKIIDVKSAIVLPKEHDDANYELDIDFPEKNALNFILNKQQAMVNQNLSVCNARKRKRTEHRIIEDISNKFARVGHDRSVLPSGSGLDAFFHSMCESTKLLPDLFQTQIKIRLSDAVTAAKICCAGLYGVQR